VALQSLAGDLPEASFLPSSKWTLEKMLGVTSSEGVDWIPNQPQPAMIKEFKDFILKGNAIDLSVGVLIGASFGNVVTAVTNGIIKPVISAMGGNPEVSLKVGIIDAGLVINAFISLLITGAVLFFVFVKPMQKLRALTEKPAAPAGSPEPTAEEKLLTEIRDLLKQKA
jgi:large conductance mechanosensitive channel